MSSGSRRSERSDRWAYLEMVAWLDQNTGRIHLVAPGVDWFHNIVADDRNSVRSETNLYAKLVKAFHEAGAMMPSQALSKYSEAFGINMTRWVALVRYDDEIRDAAMKLMPLGSMWVDKLGEAFFALDEDRRYLSNIVSRLTDEAMVEAREAERSAVLQWLEQIAELPDGERTSRESVAILIELRARGYHVVRQSRDIAVSFPARGTYYVRSNDDIIRLGEQLLYAPQQKLSEPTSSDHDALSDNDDDAAPQLETWAKSPTLLPPK